LLTLLALLPFLLSACAGSPSQKPTQTVAPDSTTAAALKDVQAQTVALAQQNTAIINAIQKSAQDADQFRTETKGGIASLTQNQFRIESWWSNVSKRLRPRLLGFGGFDAVVLAAGNNSDLGKPGSSARSSGPDNIGNSSLVQVKKGPTVLELFIAFVLGVVAASVFAALDQNLAAKIEIGEAGIIDMILGILTSLWAKIFGKKKTATPAAK
jgi:hypothetical protein